MSALPGAVPPATKREPPAGAQGWHHARVSDAADPAASPTRVTFPSGATEGTSTVVSADVVEGGVLVVVEETPFHPLDPWWPDQPDDTGWLEVGGERRAVLRALTVVDGPDGRTVNDAITVRREEPGVALRVGHLVEGEGVPDAGREVRLVVDGQRRRALSAAHTGCHLVAAAFNEAADGLWRKDAPRDSRGHRDFDQLAIVSSRHHPGGSVDTYRLGKSLQKKGLPRADLAERLDALVEATDATLRAWLATDAPVEVRADGPWLTSPREFVCELPGGAIRMRCGGTHVARLGEVARIDVTAELSEDGTKLALHARTTTTDGA